MAGPSRRAEAPEKTQNQLEILSHGTCRAKILPYHYFCDRCFRLHPIAPVHGEPSGCMSYRETSKYTYILGCLKTKAANALFRRSFDDRMAHLEQTHTASVNTSDMATMGYIWPGELENELKQRRMSAVRPPCKQQFPLLQLSRRIPTPPEVAGYFHMHIYPNQDGRRTPFAGLLHHHVQRELKRFRMFSEHAAGTWYCPAPPRRLKTYKGVSEDNNHEMGEVKLPYLFEPRIVKHNKEDLFVMKTTVKASPTTPLSFCPHQVVVQIPERNFAHSDVMANFFSAKCNGASIRFDHEYVPLTEEEQAPLFTYRLKDVSANRKPGEIDGLRDAAIQNYRLLRHNTSKLAWVGYNPALYAACRHCPTEIKLRYDGSTMTYTVWQNLGAEGSALDPVWQSYLPGPFLQHTHNYSDERTLSYMTAQEQAMPWQENTYRAGPSVFAKKGAIRRMYKSCR